MSIIQSSVICTQHSVKAELEEQNARLIRAIQIGPKSLPFEDRVWIKVEKTEDCYLVLLMMLNDTSLCDKVKKSEKNYCYRDIAFNLMDSKICGKILNSVFPSVSNTLSENNSSLELLKEKSICN